jgi:two-component system, chemotaxis family, sensor kinase CheA
MNQEVIDEFINESKDHLAIIEESLLKLEQDNQDKNTINSLFRAIHSIKGGSGFFGFTTVSELAHSMENLLYKARNDELELTGEHIDILFAGLDLLRENFENPDTEIEIDDIVQQLNTMLGPEEEPSQVEIIGRPFDKLNAPFEKFKINEKDLQKAVDDGMNIYAIRAFLQKDIHDKQKSPYQYTEQIEQLGYFIDSYLDIFSIPIDLDQESSSFDLPFVFLFATVMDETLVETGVDVPANQIIQIDTSPFKKGLKVKSKNGNVVDLQQKAQQIDDNLKEAAKSITRKTEPPSPPKETGMQVEETLRVKVSQLNKLVNLAGELVLARNQLLSISGGMSKEVPGLHGILQNINLVTTEMQTEIMNARMQPMSIVFSKFPRLIRDLAQKLNKKINFRVEGTEVEVDKTILEAISDPLTHLVRNVGDHAIEPPDQRLAAGKDEEGQVLLKAYHEGGLVNIDITDDGKGIDPETVIDKAIKKRLVSAEEGRKLSEKEKINFIFAPGFSTAEVVTDVSGRGVGMDVVKTNIEKLGGSVDIDSKVGKGTTVKITLPLTLAIVTSLIVETENQKFAIPQISIEELYRIKPEEFHQRIATVQGGQVLRIRGKLLPLIHLADSIKLPRTFKHPVTEKKLPERRSAYSAVQLTEEGLSEKLTPEAERRIIYTEALRVLIVKSGDTHFGLIVDKIIGSEEIVVKPMPQHFRHLKSYAGATILGDGRVALIIDVPGLADKNKLLFRETDTIQTKQEISARDRHQETAESVNLLFFDTGTTERYAIPVGLIERVDVLPADQIEIISDKFYSSYKGFSMRLIHLADYIPIQRSDKETRRYRVVIPKSIDIPIGILIQNVIDTRETVFELEENILKQRGIIGSAVIDNKITLLLDMLSIIEDAEPNCLETIRKHKAQKVDQTILLAEDTQFYMKLVSDYLKNGGYNVITAENGALALEKLRQHTVDIVVSDIEMPEMDGFGLIAEIKRDPKLNKLPVIALTSLSDQKIVEKGIQAGFNEWCVKLDEETLLDTIRKHING